VFDKNVLFFEINVVCVLDLYHYFRRKDTLKNNSRENTNPKKTTHWMHVD